MYVPDKSVKKYNLGQLAHALNIIYKNAKGTHIPDDLYKLNQEIRQMYTWQMNERHLTIPGIGDTRNVLITSMIYAQKYKPVNNSKKMSNDIAIIAELDKQIDDLKKLIERERNDVDNKNLDQLKEKLDLKISVLDKIKSNHGDDANIDKFDGPKMKSIIRRVFEIFKNSGSVADNLYREFDLLTKPVYDYEKESMGGNYILKNSKRDRIYNAELNNNWRDRKGQEHVSLRKNDNQKQNIGKSKSITKSSRAYVPPHVQPEKINTTGKKSYVPPFRRKNNDGVITNDNTRHDGWYTLPNKREYVAKKSRGHQSYCSDGDNHMKNRYGIRPGKNMKNDGFVSLDKLSGSIKLDSVEEFPELPKNSNNGDDRPNIKNNVVSSALNALNALNEQNIYDIPMWNLSDDETNTDKFGQKFSDVVKKFENSDVIPKTNYNCVDGKTSQQKHCQIVIPNLAKKSLLDMHNDHHNNDCIYVHDDDDNYDEEEDDEDYDEDEDDYDYDDYDEDDGDI